MSAPQALLGGRYRLLKPLASGGMGSVWEARDEVLQRPVAVKQLLHQPGLSPRDAEDAVNRAMREARITARLHHPNAVPVYDVVEQDGRPSLIMQYVPSRSLQDILSTEGVLPAASVAGIGADIAAALAAAHQAGIVHRDVKPSNVLITEDGTAKLTDFGVSHAVGDVNLTSTGMVTGTPAFLSPEVARGATSNAAADVFSLGATLYAALEGTPPFGSGANAMATLHRVASGQFAPPRRSGPLTPLLTRMLAADPDERPPIVDVRNTLAALRDDLGLLGSTTRRMAAPVAASTAELPATAALPAASRLGGARSDLTQPHPAPPLGPGGLQQHELRPPTGPAGSPPVAETDDRTRPRRLLPVLILAGAVLVAAALLATALLGGGEHRTTAGTAHAPATATTAHPSAAAPTSRQPTTTQAAPAAPPATHPSTPPSPTPTPSPTGQPATPTAAQLAGAITSYYALLPGDTADAWNRLTPNFQQTTATNRQTYDAWWASIAQVQASNVSGTAPDQATATITYHFKDGRVVVEQDAFRLVPMDGMLKIDQSSVLSSQTQ